MRPVYSLCMNLWMVAISAWLGWGTEAAAALTLPVMVCHEALEIVMKWHAWRVSNRSMVVHHGMVIAGCVVVLVVRQGFGEYPHEVYRVARWMLFSEVSSVFYNLRMLLVKTAYEPLATFAFGVAFFVVRTAVAVGSHVELFRNSFFWTLMPFVCGMHALNVVWGVMILRKLRGDPPPFDRDLRRLPPWLLAATLAPTAAVVGLEWLST
jgi:hypothetical protein